MIKPIAKAPNTTVTTVSVISHLGDSDPSAAAFHFLGGARNTPRPVPGEGPNGMIIVLLASPGPELICLFGVRYKQREECDFARAGCIQQSGRLLVMETTFAIIKQL